MITATIPARNGSTITSARTALRGGCGESRLFRSLEPHPHDSDDDRGADHGHHGGGHSHGDGRGIEWEDDVVAVNRLTTPANMRWKLAATWRVPVPQQPPGTGTGGSRSTPWWKIKSGFQATVGDHGPVL
jgi:hypothetical protein